MRKFFLKEIFFQTEKLSNFDFRKNLEIFHKTKSLKLHTNIAYFVWENGSGKSTLMEAIAKEFGLNEEWWTRNSLYKTNFTDKNADNFVKLSWQPTKFSYGYFFRAEWMYNFVNYLETIDWFDPYGEVNLHTMSHGEKFLKILESISTNIGLYIFDEVESALSPANQIKAREIIRKMAENGSQFLISTHSPILLSIKENSEIFSCDFAKITKIPYENAPCVDIYKRFLNGYFDQK